MQVVDVRREDVPGGARVVARVLWEDVDRPPLDLFVRTEDPFAADLHPCENAFLTAVAWPAFHAGERRIRVEGVACPRLCEGLLTVLGMQRRWRRMDRPLPVIEAGGGFVASVGLPRRRVGLFLSGGADSLASLALNRAAYPREHPRAVQDALFVHGLDIGGAGQGPRLGFYERARAALAPLAAEAHVTLIPAWTNVRALEPDGRAWADAWFGPGTVALAHAFDRRISDVLLAASLDVEGLTAMGSHPASDPYLSSATLDVHHDGLRPSRLAKLGLVAAWPTALRALRVCWQDGPDDAPLNCGRCRKCVRAMLGLLALGALERAVTFPRRTLSASDLDVCAVDGLTVRFYEELLEPLRACGREDLAAVLRGRLAAWRREARWPSWRRVRRWARRLGGGRRRSSGA